MIIYSGIIKRVIQAPPPSGPNPYGKIGDKFNIHIKNQSSIVVKLEHYAEMPLSDSWPEYYFYSPDNWSYQNTQTKWTVSGCCFSIESENGSVIEGVIEVNPSINCGLKSLANNRYVCAEKAGAEKLIANRDSIRTWESFEIINIPDGQVCIKSLVNNKFICVDTLDKGYLFAKCDTMDNSTKFEIEYYSNKTFSLKSMINKKYVCADINLNGVLIANRDNAKTWEKFSKETKEQV